MPADYFGEPDDAAPSKAQAKPEGSTEPEEDDDGGEEIVSKDFFGDKEIEPGHKCTVEVVHIYDDSVGIKYVKADDAPKKSQMEESEGSLEKMGKPAMGY